MSKNRDGYLKQYYLDNKEKIRGKQAEYYVDHKENIKDSSNKYYRDNKDKVKKSLAAYYVNNREKIKKRVIDHARVQKTKNPRQYMIISARYRAKKEKLSFDLTIEDIVIPEICPI